MTDRRRRSMAPDDGPSWAEFALILALIAIVSIAALIALGGQISGTLETVSKPV